MSKLSNLSRCRLAKETTMGTPVLTGLDVPWDTFEPEDTIDPIPDTSVRANDTLVQDQYGGLAKSAVSLGGNLYPDLAGHLLRAMGLVDSIGAAVGGLYPHTMKSTGAQPPTYTIIDDDNLSASARAYPGQMLTDLTLKVDVAASSAVTFDSKWVGWASVTTASITPTFTTPSPFLPWMLTWSAAAAASDRVQNAELSFKRGVTLLPGSDGNQTMRETFGDTIEYAIKATALFEDQTDLNRFLTYGKVATVATLTKPAGLGGESLAITSTRGVWQKAAKKRSQKYLTLDFEVTGTYGATDAGPCAVLLNNLIAPAY
ncbi:MAG: hypothetical protein JWM93_2774 [Frankiales bacterium]|nr:hypothetical protein [Frankiales bacterium]